MHGRQASERTAARTIVRLAGMMGLVYAVQGAWWPSLAIHLRDLGVSGRGQGWIFATMAMSSLAMPPLLGWLADRKWATQHVLAALLCIGSVCLGGLALGPTRDPLGLFAIFLGYALLGGPVYSLAASLAFRNLACPRSEYGGVRMWGTVGWMVVNWIVAGALLLASSPGQGAPAAFWVASAVSMAAGLYCLTLPNTPPLAKSADSGTWQEAVGVLSRPNVALFLASAFAVCITTPWTYQVLPPMLRDRGIPVGWVTVMMSLTQAPEILALVLLPRLMQHFGYRWTLALGIGCWVGRYGILSFDPPTWAILAGIPLHGLAIASFHIGGQLYLDSQAPTQLRASTQGVYLMITSGIGALAGNLVVGELMGALPGQYGLIFLVPTLVNLGAFGLFLGGFRNRQSSPEPAIGGRLAVEAG
ncbi:MAG: MFS transporter [Isosphaeraceae bacterium]